jgi:hypothetical protein
VRNLVKQDKLDPSQRKQLALVPQPASDAPKLTKWLAGIKAEVGQMRTIAAKLKQGNKSKASSLVVRLTHDANTTNNS